jgi:hypothetical protein
LDENPNCARTHASFRLAGSELIVADVTRRLGLKPQFTAEKGELRSARRGEPIRQPTGIWSISSENALETTSIERHLRFLLSELEPVSEALAEVVESQGLDADFFCYWLSATGHGGPEVTPETLRQIADLRAVLGFDFYGPFPESDAEDSE